MTVFAVPLLLVAQEAPADEALGAVVATVGGTKIYERQLDDRVQAERKLRYMGADLTDSELVFLHRLALERLIDQELLYQAARDKRLRVSRRELSREVEAASAPFASAETFKDHLARAGLSVDELMDQAERRLIIGAYTRGVTRRVDVREADVRKKYEEEQDRFTTHEEVRALHIVALIPPDAPAEDRETARKVMEDLRRRAEEGEEFAELARAYSQSPFAEKGGDLGFIPRGRMRPKFDAVVFRTPVGAITPVFETAYGFNLVKVVARRDATVRPYDEVKAGLTMHLVRERQKEALREHVKKLWERGNVVILDPELQP